MIVDERTRQRLAATTRFADIRELGEVDSTNRYLMGLAQGGAPEGVVVVADYQSAGRGRRGRVWEAPPGGALLVSVLLRPDPAAMPPNRRWLAGAAVALAALEAAGGAVDIKWPNDLLVGGRKLAGILAEAGAGAVVVGIGINVAWAPPGAAHLGESVQRGALLGAVLENLEGWCQNWAAVGDAYRRHCATLGRAVRVEALGETILGRAEAVELDGALRVATEKGPRSFHAADVIHVTDP